MTRLVHYNNNNNNNNNKSFRTVAVVVALVVVLMSSSSSSSSISNHNSPLTLTLLPTAQAFIVERHTEPTVPPPPQQKKQQPLQPQKQQPTKNKDALLPSRIVFGTAALGQAKDPLLLLDAAYQKGFARFDLARTYGGGVSERLFGEWLQSRTDIARERVEIITKGGMGQDKYGSPTRPLLTRATLCEEVEASLAALQTSYVDMYMFHRDDPRLPASQFVEWAHELIISGAIKSWGVSNWSLTRFQQAYEYAIQHNLEPPRANSPQLSLAVPQCQVWPTTESLSGHVGSVDHNDNSNDKDDISWYQQHGIELLCWEVLAKGFLAKPELWSRPEELVVDVAAFEPPVDSSQDAPTQYEQGTDQWRLERLQRAYCSESNYRRRQLAVQIAKQHDYKLSQVALSYILGMGPNINVIFGSTNVDHLDDVVHLGECPLDDEAKRLLDQSYQEE